MIIGDLVRFTRDDTVGRVWRVMWKDDHPLLGKPVATIESSDGDGIYRRRHVPQSELEMIPARSIE